MDCFICSHRSVAPIGNTGFLIKKEFTKFTDQSVEDAIKKLIGNTLDVTIDEQNIICITCLTLINELDRITYETSLLERILTRQIKRNYQLEMHENQLLDIDGIALLSFNINDNGMHSCKRCMNVVQCLDEVAAHYKYHQITDILSIKQIIKTEPLEENITPECASTNYVIGNKENLNPQLTSLPPNPPYQPENLLLPASFNQNQHPTVPFRQPIRVHLNNSIKPNAPLYNETSPTHRIEDVSSFQEHKSSSQFLLTNDVNMNITAVADQDNFEFNNTPDYFKDDPLEAELSELFLESNVREMISTSGISELSQIYYHCKLCPFVSYRFAEVHLKLIKIYLSVHTARVCHLAP